MKILILTGAFYPENSPRSFRASELAREFVRKGHQVKVITHPSIETKTFCDVHSISFKSLGELTWRVPKIKGTGISALFNRVIIRLTSLLFEYPMIQLTPLVKKALNGENGYDILISVAVPYPIHWGVSAIRSEKKPIAKIWVADCGDPYMGQENDTFNPPFYFGWLEKKFCRKADFITVPTSASIGGYYPEFREKIRVIPQGFRFEDIQRDIEGIRQDKVIFGYGGMFIPGRRDPSEFLDYINSLDHSMNFEFHVYTATPQLVEPFVQASKGRIKIKPVINRIDLLQEMGKMHFVVNFENVGLTQTPSKLIDFAIIGKPILSVRFGALNKEVVLEFLNKNFTNSLSITNPDQFRIENVAKKFLELSKLS
jgi:hypothetical protein